MTLLQRLNTALTSGQAITRIILINSAIFLMFGIGHALVFLSGSSGEAWASVSRALMLPASFLNFMYQPWSLLTYMFMHDSFFHILFNMLWLYWIGNILQEYLGNRKVMESYLAGGVFGGLIYMISYTLFPVFSSQINFTYAIGASAGVLAVVVSTATLLPDYSISLMFFGPVRLKFLAIASIVLDFINIPNGNAGGHIAHLGGAFAGFLYIRFLYKRGGHLFPDKLFNLFEKKSKLNVHAGGRRTPGSGNPTSQQEIDAILDKISKSGYDSLSKKEKEILFKASKD